MIYEKGVGRLILDRREEAGLAIDMVAEFPRLAYPYGRHNLFANATPTDLDRISAAHLSVGVERLGAKLLPHFAQVVPLARPTGKSRVRFDALTPVVLEAEEFQIFQEATILTALQDVLAARAENDPSKAHRTVNGARLLGAVLLRPHPDLLTQDEDTPDQRFIKRYLEPRDPFAASVRQGAEAFLKRIEDGRTPRQNGTVPDPDRRTRTQDDSSVEGHLESNRYIVELARPALLDCMSAE